MWRTSSRPHNFRREPRHSVDHSNGKRRRRSGVIAVGAWAGWRVSCTGPCCVSRCSWWPVCSAARLSCNVRQQTESACSSAFGRALCLWLHWWAQCRWARTRWTCPPPPSRRLTDSEPATCDCSVRLRMPAVCLVYPVVWKASRGRTHPLAATLSAPGRKYLPRWEGNPPSRRSTPVVLQLSYPMFRRN